MKTLTRVLKKEFKEMSDAIDPEQVVFSIWTEDGFRKLEHPTYAKDIVCPSCGSSYGGFIFSEKAWTCRNPECEMKDDIFVKNNGKFIGEDRGRKRTHDLKVDCITVFNVPEERKKASFDSWYHDKKHKDFLIKYSQDPRGIVTCLGKSGNGKTYGACSTLEAYRRNGGQNAKFLLMKAFHLEWKEALLNHISEKALLYSYIDCDILVLDDLGTNEYTNTFLELILFLIEQRGKNRGTLITTNLELNEISTSLGARIFSRMSGGKFLSFIDRDERYFEREE